MEASSSPYQQAATLLNQLWSNDLSLKSLVYKDGQLVCSKATYAQVCHVLSHRSQLDAILSQVPIDGVKNQGLLYVLLYELLFGPNKSIRGGGVLKRKLMKQLVPLKTALESFQHNEPLQVPRHDMPRYVRVNTLRTTISEFIQCLKSKQISVQRDDHVPDLLVVPTEQTANLLADRTLKGKFVLQDKSSCFSALCLVHGFDSARETMGDCLDACAAPGNKTTHLAALLAAEQHDAFQTVFALDRSLSRLQILQTRVKELIPASSRVQVVAKHGDFLAHSPTDYPTVRAILLDPSCSGSGIFTSLDRMHDDDETSHERLDALSSFQLKALQHAMSFPLVERIVYSTCSLHVQENEAVVAQALQDQRHEWRLVAPPCLGSWKRRGLEFDGLSAAESAALVRVDRDDETNGFVVGCFQRTNRNVVRTMDSSNTSQIALQSDQQGKHKRTEQPVSSTSKKKRVDRAAQPTTTSSSPVELLSSKSKKKRVDYTAQPTTTSSSPLELLSSKSKKKRVDCAAPLTTTSSGPVELLSKSTMGTKAKNETTHANVSLHSAPRPPTSDSSGKPLVPTKVLKKLEWKRKQRHEKQLRLAHHKK